MYDDGEDSARSTTGREPWAVVYLRPLHLPPTLGPSRNIVNDGVLASSPARLVGPANLEMPDESDSPKSCIHRHPFAPGTTAAGEGKGGESRGGKGGVKGVIEGRARGREASANDDQGLARGEWVSQSLG